MPASLKEATIRSFLSKRFWLSTKNRAIVEVVVRQLLRQDLDPSGLLDSSQSGVMPSFGSEIGIGSDLLLVTPSLELLATFHPVDCMMMVLQQPLTGADGVTG